VRGEAECKAGLVGDGALHVGGCHGRAGGSSLSWT
jgi:hypothetical protein